MEDLWKFKVKDSIRPFCPLGMLGCVMEGWLCALGHFLWSCFRVTPGLGSSPTHWTGCSVFPRP